jgi:hypothetical protein
MIFHYLEPSWYCCIHFKWDFIGGVQASVLDSSVVDYKIGIFFRKAHSVKEMNQDLLAWAGYLELA